MAKSVLFTIAIEALLLGVIWWGLNMAFRLGQLLPCEGLR